MSANIRSCILLLLLNGVQKAVSFGKVTTKQLIQYVVIKFRKCAIKADCRVLEWYTPPLRAQHIKSSRRQIILSNRGPLRCRDVTSSGRVQIETAKLLYDTQQCVPDALGGTRVIDRRVS